MNPPKLPPVRPDAALSADPSSTGVITTFTLRDVLNGRGQGVQRHPGNVKYRTLVYANKQIYAQCPRNDKIKISKGIVAAVRKLGGRFLDLDERTRTYTDIGDKKATEKTSQALREGQTKIRQDIYQNKDTSMPMLPPPPTDANGKLEISGEGYYGFSVQVLEALYNAENNMTPEMAARPAPHSVATQLGLQQNLDGQIFRAQSPGLSQAHMVAVLDQFDGMVPVQQQQQATTHPTMPPPDPRVPDSRPTLSSSPLRDTMLSRLTGLSLMSDFSSKNISELMEAYEAGERPSTDSTLLAEIRELVRRSEPELANIHLQDMNLDDFGGRESSYDLRFTDLSKERFTDVDGGIARTFTGETARTTESSTSTSLMQRDTVLTIPPHGYSSSTAHAGQQQQSATAFNDRASVMSVDIAEALLRLSRDSNENEMQMD